MTSEENSRLGTVKAGASIPLLLVRIYVNKPKLLRITSTTIIWMIYKLAIGNAM